MKGINHLELNECNAFVRFIYNIESNSSIIAVYDNTEMIAFAACEPFNDQYAMGHFLL